MKIKIYTMMNENKIIAFTVTFRSRREKTRLLFVGSLVLFAPILHRATRLNALALILLVLKLFPYLHCSLPAYLDSKKLNLALSLVG